MYKKIIGIDPSGNFEEGKGTTGIAVYSVAKQRIVQAYSIYAGNYETKELYWKAVVNELKTLVNKSFEPILVCEDYVLYKHKADSQTNSKMETPKLIGILEYEFGPKRVPFVLQPAHEVKNRWNDDILVHKGILFKNRQSWYIPGFTSDGISKHAKDAVRHAVHYAVFKNKDKL